METDPLKKSLDLWRVNPPIDAALAVKIRQRAEGREDGTLALFLSQKQWRMAALCLLALGMVIAGFAGSAVGMHQSLADIQAIVALYLSKINPM